ncbi:DUF6333 family protein [Streptomyces malaysiensis]|uniref:Uncharacterized protein n=1 Tax=Streptomyces malaysiensis TaxID=92644 RepID=A0A2J7YY79_STRMQ|nr:DUF6333 family protein [Streptomyces malaysiensis]PNG92981.1 hypothetical protein SMF913_28446 [Streptomyces malaysiensis]
MSDETLWDHPSDEPVERHGEFTLTVVHPPFPGPDGVLGAHDEARARAFAETFGTVHQVLDEQGTIPVTEFIDVDTRADLEVIRVGCWGGVTEINDPALISLSERFPVQEQAEALADRHPDAVIVAAAEMDLPGADYGTWKIVHPDGARIFAAGFSGEEDWDVEGEVTAVLDAFGTTPERAAAVGVDPAQPPRSFAWDALARLALKAVSPTDRRGLMASVFRVRHTEDAIVAMEDTWFER